MHSDVVEDGLHRFWRRCVQTRSLRFRELDTERAAEVLNSIPEAARTSRLKPFLAPSLKPFLASRLKPFLAPFPAPIFALLSDGVTVVPGGALPFLRESTGSRILRQRF